MHSLSLLLLSPSSGTSLLLFFITKLACCMCGRTMATCAVSTFVLYPLFFLVSLHFSLSPLPPLFFAPYLINARVYHVLSGQQARRVLSMWPSTCRITVKQPSR